MVSSTSDSQSLTIRPCQYRDLEKIANVSGQMRSGLDITQYGTRLEFSEQLHYVKRWYGPLKCLQLFPNPLQHFFSAYVAEHQQRLSGFVQVSPFNYTRSTWRVERIAACFPPQEASGSGAPAVRRSPHPIFRSNHILSPPSKQTDGSGNSAISAAADDEQTVGAQDSLITEESAQSQAAQGQTDYNAKAALDPSVSSQASSEAKVQANQRVLATPEPLATDVASQLLRYCLDTIWEARTWMVEVGIADDRELALYRHHGFQPLAHVTYWAIAPDLLESLAARSATALNLRPASNADAGLLHQLDTVSMPPLVRQVFDRHVSDFKVGLPEASLAGLNHLLAPEEVVSSYVFEPQRKAAIGYYRIQLCRDGSQPHTAKLTVHPAYTWLYPELLTQMARVVQKYPTQSLQLTSSDYQTEREEYLEQVGATRTQHTLLMSRSVWHKVRETKHVSLDNLQLSGVLQGWQPGQKPIPGRFSFDTTTSHRSHRRTLDEKARRMNAVRLRSKYPGRRGHHQSR